MGELVSAAPEELRRFRDVASDDSAALIRRAAALEGALGWLAHSGSAGLGQLPSDLGARVRRHARAVAALGRFVGDVGDAFASVSAATVVRTDQATILEWLLDTAATAEAQSPQYPEEWPGLVPGDNGCPAVSMPIWMGIGNDRGERETFDEPLWTALQTDCDPAISNRRVIPQETAWETGVVTTMPGFGFVTVLPPGRPTLLHEAAEGEENEGPPPTPRRPLPRPGLPPFGTPTPDVEATIGAPGRGAPQSAWERWAENRGWRRTQSATGPIVYVDDAGYHRVTIKEPSVNAPLSNFHRVALTDSNGWRIDENGILVTKNSPGSHIPFVPD